MLSLEFAKCMQHENRNNSSHSSTIAKRQRKKNHPTEKVLTLRFNQKAQYFKKKEKISILEGKVTRSKQTYFNSGIVLMERSRFQFIHGCPLFECMQ